MARKATRADFVDAVADEISSGIDRAVRYWLGRIELEVVDRSLSTDQRIYAIEQILSEYKNISTETQLGCASA